VGREHFSFNNEQAEIEEMKSRGGRRSGSEVLHASQSEFFCPNERIMTAHKSCEDMRDAA
jgi:hypothetical protein